MAGHVYPLAAGLRLPHNATAIARLAQPLHRERLGASDREFFDTRDASASHTGIDRAGCRLIRALLSRSHAHREHE